MGSRGKQDNTALGFARSFVKRNRKNMSVNQGYVSPGGIPLSPNLGAPVNTMMPPPSLVQPLGMLLFIFLLFTAVSLFFFINYVLPKACHTSPAALPIAHPVAATTPVSVPTPVVPPSVVRT